MRDYFWASLGGSASTWFMMDISDHRVTKSVIVRSAVSKKLLFAKEEYNTMALLKKF